MAQFLAQGQISRVSVEAVSELRQSRTWGLGVLVGDDETMSVRDADYDDVEAVHRALANARSARSGRA